MRGKGEGGVFRVPADVSKPLKYWTATVELPSHDGKRRRKVVRDKDKPSLLKKKAVIEADLRERGDLPTSSQSVAQWFTYWYEQIVLKEVRPKTAAGYKTVITKHIIPTIGTVKLDKVSAATVRRVTDRITDELGLSSTYALNAHRIMSASFEIAMREGRIGRNPAKLTKAPRRAIPKLEALDLDEAIQLLKILARDEHKELGARWITALLSGARRGEVIGLERDRVGDSLDLSWQLQRLPTGARGTRGEVGVPIVPADFEYRHLVDGLYLTRPKSQAGWRVIPLVDPLKSILERYMETTPPNEYGLLFTLRGRPIDPDQDTRAWRDFIDASPIKKNVRLHDLRHSTVDLLLEAGVHEDVVMEIVGHSSRAVTRGYKSRNSPRVREAMLMFSALLTDQGDGETGTRAVSA